MRLLDLLFPPRVDEVLLRTAPRDGLLTRVMPKLVPDTRPGTVALLPYSDELVRATLHEAKYHGSEAAFRSLGQALSDYIRDADDLGQTAELIPIPLGKERRKERGYNQVEEVVRRATHELKMTVRTDLLVRVQETVSQVSLPREEREKNMRGAFRATHSADPTITYLVVDDVITTGATLQAAIDALRAAGATHIVPLALAH